MRIPWGPAGILSVPLTCVPAFLVYWYTLDFWNFVQWIRALNLYWYVLIYWVYFTFVYWRKEPISFVTSVCRAVCRPPLLAGPPLSRVCVKFDIVESLTPAEEMEIGYTLAKILGT